VSNKTKYESPAIESLDNYKDGSIVNYTIAVVNSDPDPWPVSVILPFHVVTG